MSPITITTSPVSYTHLLLVRQVELTGGLITQKKEGRAKDTEEQVRRLNENADRIAELLASATPEYEESVLKEMFRMHVDLTGQEINERLAGNYEKDLQTFWNIPVSYTHLIQL